MQDTSKGTLAAAVAAGYLLGRTRKAKLALTVASVVAGRHLAPNPRDAVTQGAQKLASDTPLGDVGKRVGDQLLVAVRAAADRSIESLADSVHQRTAGLTGDTAPAREDADADAEEEEEDGQGKGEQGGTGGDEDGGKDDGKSSTSSARRPAKKQAAKSRSGGKTSGSAKSSARSGGSRRASTSSSDSDSDDQGEG